MNTLLDTLWYFYYITVELVVLFIVITALVEIILMYIPQEKISKKIEKAGFLEGVAEPPLVKAPENWIFWQNRRFFKICADIRFSGC